MRSELLDALSPDSVDVFIDNYGYDPDCSLATVRRGGAYVSIVHQAPSVPKPGVANVTLVANASTIAASASKSSGRAAGTLRPVVKKTFPIDSAVTAMRAAQQGVVGKVGLTAIR